MTQSTFTTQTVQFPCNGETIIGNLFTPQGKEGPFPALVFLGPLTSVKEQVPGHYAAALAKRGFVTIAIDNRHFGKSTGQPRQYENPNYKVEDIQATLDFLSSLKDVDADKLGAIGICAGAGYMAGAVAKDTRIKGFGGVAGFYHDAAMQKVWMGDRFQSTIEMAKDLREQYEKTGKITEIPAVGKEGDVAMPLDEAFEYYGTPRGDHENYRNAFNLMSREHTLPWHARGYAKEITVPALIIHSEKALMPSMARNFYADLAGKKEEIWMQSKGQIDFYDDEALIEPAADALAEHFTALF